jgi:hypothetical protein
MTQGLFGAVTPGWTGMAPVPAWPAFGASFTGTESMQGTPGVGYANAATSPAMSGYIGTPLFMPGSVPASTVIATMAMRRGQLQGPINDQDVEELLYDAIELMPGAGEIEVRSEGGRVSLTGSVPNKRVKRDVGELAWAIPGINDVNNVLNISTRRRARAFTRESETQPSAPSRKQA